MIYKFLKFFIILGIIFFSFGFFLCVCWLILYWSGIIRVYVFSLVLVVILILIGFQLFIFGLIVDLMLVNCKFLEDI